MSKFHLSLLPVLLQLATLTLAATILPPAPSPTNISNRNATPTTLAPPPPLGKGRRNLPRELQFYRQQLNNIIDALLGAGDFNSWANVLSVADPSTLPLSATLFIPADDSLSPIGSTITVDPFIFPYHIVPQRLAFGDLRQFKRDSRLPTLLVSKSILITNNSISNFTLDDSLLSHPDLFTTETIAVHGIATLLDYSVYGGANPKPSQPEVLPRPPPGMFVPAGELISDRPDSNAACFCTEVWTVFLIFCVVLASKIQRMSFGQLLGFR